MADELLDLDFNDNELQERVSKSEKRIKDLSEKVKLTSQERDELATAKTALEQEKAHLAKETEFYKTFNTLMPKYQGSADFQDKIKEKYMSGYELEDATISVMTREGKFNPAPTVPPARENPAGGSAVTQITSPDVDKPIEEMSREEKRKLLMENSPEVEEILRPNINMGRKG